MVLLAVFVGGGLGSMCRFYMSHFNVEHPSTWMTLGTFLANMLSCLILGLVIGYQAKHGLSQEFRSLLLVGFCGGFSTFSTFSYELLNYLQKGEYLIGAGYLLLSVFISIALIIIGTKMI